MFPSTTLVIGKRFATTPQIIFLTNTSGGYWQVPSDWNSYKNTIECIGGGSGGGGGDQGGNGGAGGAYSRIDNLLLTPGNYVQWKVGAGGSGGANDPDNPHDNGNPGGDTWFNGTSRTQSSVSADGGGYYVSSSDRNCHYPGYASASIGSIKYDGGAGQKWKDNDNGYGGGGAAGPGGAGNPGVNKTGGAGGGGSWTSTLGAYAAPGKGGNEAQNGSSYGGGGGGGEDNRDGKAGAQGIIVITYYPWV